MSKKNTLFCFFIPALLGVSVSSGQSVTVTLNLPAQRDTVIANGAAFLAARDKTIVDDTGAPDPFIGKVVESIVEEATVENAPIAKVVINEVELLQNLANKMPARGTAIMGEDRFLLLSQKRLKVGDSTIISFDGKDYEVWLTGLSSTTFTIRRNELTYTRAVLLSR